MVAVLNALERAGIEVWVDGGWGVDALLGREVRSHKDLDLVLRLSDAGAAVELIQAMGFAPAGSTPPSALLSRWVRAGGGPLRARLRCDRRGVYRPAEGGERIYPAAGFEGRGTIAGKMVRCLTPEAQMLLHGGYDPTDKDMHDVQLLHDAFGLALPDDYARRATPPPP